MNKAFRRQAPAFPSTKCALVMVAVLLLPGCAREGDFGRPETYTFLGHPLDAAYWTSGLKKGSKSTKFGQTPAETEMRETAYRLRVQIGSLKPMKLSLSPETAYAERLTYEQHTYGPSRAALMEQELEADHQALSRFADAARRVLAADRQRMFALLSSQDYLSKADNRSARNRMRKNYAFIEGTFVDLDKRIAAYDHAIDRTRIETPGVLSAGMCPMASSRCSRAFRTKAAVLRSSGLSRRSSEPSKRTVNSSPSTRCTRTSSRIACERKKALLTQRQRTSSRPAPPARSSSENSGVVGASWPTIRNCRIRALRSRPSRIDRSRPIERDGRFGDAIRTGYALGPGRVGTLSRFG
jgi:hypothetical protein